MTQPEERPEPIADHSTQIESEYTTEPEQSSVAVARKNSTWQRIGNIIGRKFGPMTYDHKPGGLISDEIDFVDGD